VDLLEQLDELHTAGDVGHKGVDRELKIIQETGKLLDISNWLLCQLGDYRVRDCATSR